MIEYPNVVPIAVAVAIVLFLAKETLELIRRLKTDGRKLHAIRRLLARECERNNWAISRLLDQLTAVDDALKSNENIEIVHDSIGNVRLHAEYVGRAFAESPIRVIHTQYLERFLFDAAALDTRLFAAIEGALDTLPEAIHVRDSLIYYVSEDQQHLEGFTDYARDELDLAMDAIRHLYFVCTCEPLAKTRVR
jgi:hypothetical protein